MFSWPLAMGKAQRDIKCVTRLNVISSVTSCVYKVKSTQKTQAWYLKWCHLYVLNGFIGEHKSLNYTAFLHRLSCLIVCVVYNLLPRMKLGISAQSTNNHNFKHLFMHSEMLLNRDLFGDPNENYNMLENIILQAKSKYLSQKTVRVKKK